MHCGALFDMDGNSYYDSAGNQGYYTNFLPVGSDNADILLTNVRCSGMESQLTDCPHDMGNRITCDHNEDVRIVCIPSDTPPGEKE